MSKKEKVLGFVKKHKTELVFGAGCAIGAVCMALGIHSSLTNDAKRVVSAFEDDVELFTWVRAIPFGAEDLGKIGEEVNGAIGDTKYTHLIMLGDK